MAKARGFAPAGVGGPAAASPTWGKGREAPSQRQEGPGVGCRSALVGVAKDSETRGLDRIHDLLHR